MRDYLYIWHDPVKRCVVASGIEFKDFLPFLSGKGGVVLLEHQSDEAELDVQSGFDYFSNQTISKLINEDIYSWGNFAWADYTAESLPAIPDQEIAELLYFAHRTKPLTSPAFPSLNNNFLAFAHDDGWYLRLYYNNWRYIEDFLHSIPHTLGSISSTELESGVHGYWLQAGVTSVEVKTDDVDSILNRRL